MDFLYTFLTALGFVGSGVAAWIGLEFIRHAIYHEDSFPGAISVGMVGAVVASLGVSGFMVLA